MIKISNKFISANVVISIISLLLLYNIPFYNKIIYISSLLFIVTYFLLKDSWAKLKIWVIPCILFIFWATFSSLRNIDDTFVITQVILIWVTTILICLTIDSNENKKLIFYAILFSSFINGLVAALHLDELFIPTLDRYDLDIDLDFRSSGVTGNANTYAIQSLLPIIILISLPEIIKLRYQILSLLLALQAVFMSQSRKATIALTILMIFAAYLKFKRSLSKKYLMQIMLLMAIFLIAIFSFTIDNTFENIPVIQRFIDIKHGESSFELRNKYILIGLDLFKNSLIYGYGLDSFKSISSIGVYSHNNYIELGVSGGLILLLSFYMNHILFIKNTLQSKKLTIDGKIYGVIIIVILLFLDTAMVSYYSPSYIFLLVMLISGNLNNSFVKTNIPK